MPFLLRVELPDVPGPWAASRPRSVRPAATSRRSRSSRSADGTAVDDVLLEIAPGAMPDSIVSACNKLDGVQVVWISRYAAGGNLFLDLEAVEELTADPARRSTGWSTCCRSPSAPTGRRGSPEQGHRARHRGGAVRSRVRPDRAGRAAGARRRATSAGRRSTNQIVLIGRRGGPEFLDSELARLGHLVSLAPSIASS